MVRELVLIGISGSRVGQPTTIAQRTCLIGCEAGCDIVLHDRQILPRHAEFRQIFGGWFIVPLTTDALVAVNGQRISSQGRVIAGDLVTIGSATFRAS